MKKWTFFDQMLASFLVIVISSILSALLHLPIVGRLAFLLVGAGFVLHPVVPVNISIQWGARALWFPPPAGGILSPVRAAGPILNAGKHFGVFHIRKKFLEVNING